MNVMVPLQITAETMVTAKTNTGNSSNSAIGGKQKFDAVLGNVQNGETTMAESENTDAGDLLDDQNAAALLACFVGMPLLPVENPTAAGEQPSLLSGDGVMDANVEVTTPPVTTSTATAGQTLLDGLLAQELPNVKTGLLLNEQDNTMPKLGVNTATAYGLSATDMRQLLNGRLADNVNAENIAMPELPPDSANAVEVTIQPPVMSEDKNGVNTVHTSANLILPEIPNKSLLTTNTENHVSSNEGISDFVQNNLKAENIVGNFGETSDSDSKQPGFESFNKSRAVVDEPSDNDATVKQTGVFETLLHNRSDNESVSTYRSRNIDVRTPDIMPTSQTGGNNVSAEPNGVATVDAKAGRDFAQKYELTNQIVERARMLKTGQSTDMVIALKPEHLGELTLKISVAKNMVSASFYTENTQVKNALEASMQQLKQELADAGIKVDTVTVYTNLPQSFYQEHSQQRHERQNYKSKNRKADVDEFASQLDGVEATGINNVADGVDYLI